MKLKRETDDESGLFREAVRGVKPLAPPDRHAAIARRARVRVGKRTPDIEDLAPVEGDDLHFHRPGVQNSVLRNLRRGKYPVQAELDLHGLTLAEAEHALREFLAAALHGHLRCVRIVHGKGSRSGGPVLRPAAASILRRTSAVMAYVSAPPAHGGTGALHVLLARHS